MAAKGFAWSAVFTLSLVLDWDNDHLTWMFAKPALPSADEIATIKAPILPVEQELAASQCSIRGTGANLAGEMIQHWDDLGTTVAWQVNLKAGEFEVVVLQAAAAVSAGNTYQVEINGQIFNGTVKDTGGWEDVQEVALGRLKVDKDGPSTVVLRPLKKRDRGVMNLQCIVLRGPGADQIFVTNPSAR